LLRNSNKKLLKLLLADYLQLLSEDRVHFFWKGRVALYAILKAIGIKSGDEVILPAFTCVVVANPIIYIGAKPVYVDINPKTFNIDVNKIEEKISYKTRVILAQNTFGLSSDLDSIIEIAKEYNLWVIEDCAHGLGGTYKGKKNGTIADAAFFSTQWNKPISTGIGGIAVTRNEKLTKRLKVIEKQVVKPSLKEELTLKLLLFIRNRLLSPSLYWFALKTYRWLSQKNLVLGSSQGYELEKPVKPPNFLKGFTETQAKEGLKYFEKVNGKYRIDSIIEHRKRIAGLYKEILHELGFEPPFEPGYAEHTYLKFPLLVKDREKFFQLAQEEKIELGDWFLSPIHPVMMNFELWNYTWGTNPVAEFASCHIVNLPTHEKIDENYVDRVYSFLKRNRDEILGCSVKGAIRG